MQWNRAKTSGFTLMELLLVLVILAVLVALISPSLRGFSRGRTGNDLAKQLVTLTRWAHTQAVSQSKTYRLNLDLNARTFWITTDDDNNVQPVETGIGTVFKIPDGVQVTSTDLVVNDQGQQTIHFFANGRTEAGTITISGLNNDVWEVSCPSESESYSLVTDKVGT